MRKIIAFLFVASGVLAGSFPNFNDLNTVKTNLQNQISVVSNQASSKPTYQAVTGIVDYAISVIPAFIETDPIYSADKPSLATKASVSNDLNAIQYVPIISVTTNFIRGFELTSFSGNATNLIMTIGETWKFDSIVLATNIHTHVVTTNYWKYVCTGHANLSFRPTYSKWDTTFTSPIVGGESITFTYQSPTTSYTNTSFNMTDSLDGIVSFIEVQVPIYTVITNGFDTLAYTYDLTNYQPLTHGIITNNSNATLNSLVVSNNLNVTGNIYQNTNRILTTADGVITNGQNIVIFGNVTDFGTNSPMPGYTAYCKGVGIWTNDIDHGQWVSYDGGTNQYWELFQ